MNLITEIILTVLIIEVLGKERQPYPEIDKGDNGLPAIEAKAKAENSTYFHNADFGVSWPPN